MESRKGPRLRTIKGGAILFGVAPPIDCVIRNMSSTGALLVVEDQAAIPDDVRLLIKPELTKRSCQVVWRRPDRIGVQFV